MQRIRKFKRLLLGLLIIGLSVTHLSAQNGLFTHEDFFKSILANHPVARQANLLGAEAEAYVLKARGGFDPKLKGDLDQKTFDGKNYFNIGEVGLSIPTWYGLEVKGGFNWNDGIFLNPERNLPAGGQAEFGISANLLQGLMIDERRATLKQAEIMRDLNAAERLSILNELLLEANDFYWQWVLNSQLVRINEEALRLAIQRFDAVMISYEQGYDAAVDTLQSSILVQSRRVALQEAQLELQNIILAISNFLWTTDDVPLELNNGLTAPLLADLPFIPISQEEISRLSQTITERHPDLLQYVYQLEQLEIDQQLKREMLKPQLTVSYSLLGDRFNFNSYQQEDDSALQNIFGQNYKWGVSMRFPLFLRKQRGDLELNRLKIQQTDFKRRQKSWNLQNKLITYANNTNIILNQINQYDVMVRSYQDLLVAENERFRLGISSLFLVNSQEQKLVEAQQKLAELRAKYQKNKVGITGVAGLLVPQG